MTQYYFRVYKRNKEFKSRKSLKPLHKFLLIFFLDEKFFLIDENFFLIDEKFFFQIFFKNNT